jgi:hypothetical protein
MVCTNVHNTALVLLVRFQYSIKIMWTLTCMFLPSPFGFEGETKQGLSLDKVTCTDEMFVMNMKYMQ